MSFSSNTHYHIRPETGACLAALTGRDGSTPFPIRTKSCQVSNDDTILWQFNPDGQGRYFIYNKAWPGKSNRLDLVLQDKTSLYIPWMGPSDDVYNNQRWSVTTSGNSFQISSFGLPGALLTVTEIQGQSSLGALLRNDIEVDNSAATWQVLDVSEDSSAPSPEPSPQNPAVESTLAPVDPIPTPKPKPTTFVTSTLPNTEQTIVEADQSISSQLPQRSSSPGDSLISTGRSSIQGPQATKTNTSSNPTSSVQPPVGTSESPSPPNLGYLGFIALGLLLIGMAIWGYRRRVKKRRGRDAPPHQDIDLPERRKSTLHLLNVMRKLTVHRHYHKPAGETSKSRAEDPPGSSTDSASASLG
ncbi:hypothetical protein V8F06_011218 [Rhypophila decipiens]